MRSLTQRERRELKKELVRSSFDLKKLRIVADCYKYDKLFLVGLNCMDTNISQRICIPFKDEPNMLRIEKQLEGLANEVFLKEDV